MHDPADRDPEQPALRRSVTLPLLTLYGLGTIVGAGIYVLVGKVASQAGVYAPVAFLVSALIAAFTAFTFAELSSRYPRSAGESYYAEVAFGRRWFSGLLGWTVVAVGSVSAATMSNGFVGYFQIFLPIPSWLIILALVVALTAVATWGIAESVWLAALITVLEVGGLLLVLYVAGGSMGEGVHSLRELVPPPEGQVWVGILLGSFLAFYAFIGFEDMVNIAEEVKNPRVTLPLGILAALGISTLLYILVSIVAVTALPLAELGASSAPLVDIVRRHSAFAEDAISVIGLIAVVNGALIQIIMAARVIYGMSAQGLAPRVFGAVHARTRTPLRATLFVGAIVLTLALGFPLVELAKATSFITLCIFACMQITLLTLKRRQPVMEHAVSYPLWVPAAGLLCTLALLGFQVWMSLSA
ncbi:MAG: amino acid permease [Gammaproteobacteria bacterium]|nr:amino acid permease [Gammaproteobacteria bacterium]